MKHTVKILAGSWGEQAAELCDVDGRPYIRLDDGAQLELGDLLSVEVQTEQSLRNLKKTAGWAIGGLALFGPAGAIGGMLLGGRGKEVCFTADFRDGSKILAVAAEKDYRVLAAAAMNSNGQAVQPEKVVAYENKPPRSNPNDQTTVNQSVSGWKKLGFAFLGFIVLNVVLAAIVTAFPAYKDWLTNPIIVLLILVTGTVGGWKYAARQ